MRSGKPFPVILFSPGLGGQTDGYSSIFLDLVSHGYVVAAITHAYDNGGIILPDNRILRYSQKWQENMSGQMKDGEKFTIERVKVMAADFAFALTQLEAVNRDKSSGFAGRLDLSKAGTMGHSLGGVVAPMACQRDSRFKACVNLDGLPTRQPYIPDEDKGPAQPFMLLTKAYIVTDLILDRTGMTRSEYETRVRANSKRRYYSLMDKLPTKSYVMAIEGATHGSFSDGPLLGANTSEELESAERLTRIIRVYTLGFFDQYLRNKKVELFDGPSKDYHEVLVEIFPGASKKMSVPSVRQQRKA